MFELPLLLEEFVLLAFLLDPCVFLKDFLILLGRLRQQALINKPIHIFEDEERGYDFWIFLSSHCFDFVDKPFDLDGAMVFDFTVVLIDDKDFSEPDPAFVEHLDLLLRLLHLRLVHFPSGLKGLLVPPVGSSKSLL